MGGWYRRRLWCTQRVMVQIWVTVQTDRACMPEVAPRGRPLTQPLWRKQTSVNLTRVQGHPSNGLADRDLLVTTGFMLPEVSERGLVPWSDQVGQRSPDTRGVSTTGPFTVDTLLEGRRTLGPGRRELPGSAGHRAATSEKECR